MEVPAVASTSSLHPPQASSSLQPPSSTSNPRKRKRKPKAPPVPPIPIGYVWPTIYNIFPLATLIPGYLEALQTLRPGRTYTRTWCKERPVWTTAAVPQNFLHLQVDLLIHLRKRGVTPCRPVNPKLLFTSYFFRVYGPTRTVRWVHEYFSGLPAPVRLAWKLAHCCAYIWLKAFYPGWEQKWRQSGGTSIMPNWDLARHGSGNRAQNVLSNGSHALDPFVGMAPWFRDETIKGLRASTDPAIRAIAEPLRLTTETNLPSQPADATAEGANLGQEENDQQAQDVPAAGSSYCNPIDLVSESGTPSPLLADEGAPPLESASGKGKAVDNGGRNERRGLKLDLETGTDADIPPRLYNSVDIIGSTSHEQFEPHYFDNLSESGALRTSDLGLDDPLELEGIWSVPGDIASHPVGQEFDLGQFLLVTNNLISSQANEATVEPTLAASDHREVSSSRNEENSSMANGLALNAPYLDFMFPLETLYPNSSSEVNHGQMHYSGESSEDILDAIGLSFLRDSADVANGTRALFEDVNSVALPSYGETAAFHTQADGEDTDLQDIFALIPNSSTSGDMAVGNEAQSSATLDALSTQTIDVADPSALDRVLDDIIAAPLPDNIIPSLPEDMESFLLNFSAPLQPQESFEPLGPISHDQLTSFQSLNPSSVPEQPDLELWRSTLPAGNLGSLFSPNSLITPGGTYTDSVVETPAFGLFTPAMPTGSATGSATTKAATSGTDYFGLFAPLGGPQLPDILEEEEEANVEKPGQ